MICLEGLNHADLNNVLDYIYQGEVQINQHDLERFLGIAERLKLEGLIGGGKLEDTDQIKNTFEEENSKLSGNDLFVSKNENHVDVRIIKKPDISFQSSDIQSMEELDQRVDESYTKVSAGLFSCNHCERTAKKVSHIKEHVETHIEGLSFSCTLCNSTLRSRNTLRNHKRLIIMHS